LKLHSMLSVERSSNHYLYEYTVWFRQL